MLFKGIHFEVCPSQVKTANNLATRKINMRAEQRLYFFGFALSCKELDMRLAQGCMPKVKGFCYQAKGVESSYGYCNVEVVRCVNRGWLMLAPLVVSLI